MSTFHSDSKRDARDTIRGYLYQIQLTVIRWLTLESNTVLYCECGEDIDHVRQVVENNKDNEERIVEQVKALSRNITLRSGESITSLARYKEHLVKNSNNSIKLIYWFSTTANPGKERASENVSINFPKDFSGIEAWQAVQKDEFSQEEIEEFVSGFKKLIESAKCPDKLEENVFLQLKDYIKSTASDTLINDFVKKFYWKTSLEQPENLDEKIKNLLICQSTVNSEEEAIQLTDTLTSYILHFLSKAGTKKLTKEDLVNFLQKRQVPDYARTLLHTIKSLKFIEETLLSISSKVDGVTELLSKQQQPKCVNVDWQKCCQTLLEKQRKLTSNSLMYSDGISKSFEDVFVPLGLVERQQKSKKADVTPTQGSKLYELEEYEIIKEYNQDEFFKEILTEGKSTKSNGKRLVVIGEPGSGKTTLLQKIADNILNNIRGYPILIFLSDLQGKNLKEYLFSKWLEDVTLTGIIEDEVKKDFERLFHSGRVWLLLDGVDEIGKEAATILKEMNEQFVGLLGEARIILTCRTNVWDAGKNSLVDFDIFKSLDFSYGDSKYPNQVKTFINKWFSSNSLRGDDLYQELERPGKERIKDIVKNPLRLALLCKFWQLGEQKLPDTKASLYKGFIDAIYDWKSDTFSAKQAELAEFLGYLAKSALNKEKYRFRLEISFIRKKIKELKQKKELDFEKIFESAEKIGLLNNVGVAIENPQEKVYAFIHPTFQEYFAAQYISNWNYFFKHGSNNPEEGNYRIFDNTWKEVILLWLGRDDIKAKRKEAFLQTLANFDDDCGGGYDARASFLAVSGVAEFREFKGSDETIKKIVDWGFNSARGDSLTESFSKSDRAVLTETDNTKATDTLINQIKTSVDLGIIKEASLHLQLVKSKIFVIDLLSDLLVTNHSNDLFSNQIVSVLGEIDPNNQKIISTLERLCCSKEEEIRCNAAGSLLFRITNNNTAVNTLLELLRTSNNSRIIWESMHHLRVVCEPPRQDVIDALINVIRSSNDQDRIMDATLYLKRMVVGNKQAITSLENIITESTNWRKIYYVIDLLREIDPTNKASISRLEELLDLYKQNEQLSVEFAQVLIWVEECNSKATDTLINLLAYSQDDYIQNQASMALEAVVPKCPLIVDKLIELTKANSSEIAHKWIAWILRKADKNKPEITSALSTLLKNAKDDEAIYQTALSLLDNSPNNGEALNALLELIKRDSTKVEVRIKTIQNLEESGCKDPNFIATLTNVLEAQQKVCCYAAEALYKIGVNKELAINKLRLLLNSDDTDLIPEVIRVLERLEVKQREVVDDLINLLKKLENVEKKTLAHQEKLKLEQNTLEEKLDLEQEALALNQEMLELEREKKIISQAASALRKLTENVEEIYPELVNLLQNHPDKYVHQIISEMLKKNIIRNNILLLVKALKKCAISLFSNKHDEQHRNCREMYWYCVQNVPYPEFCRAWHS